jgi:hypothetical protein
MINWFNKKCDYIPSNTIISKRNPNSNDKLDLVDTAFWINTDSDTIWMKKYKNNSWTKLIPDQPERSKRENTEK